MLLCYETYPRPAERAWPRTLKLLFCPRLRYGRAVKERDEQQKVIGSCKQSRYGKSLDRITKVYIEPHNLTLWHGNRRLSRKTLVFFKKLIGIDESNVHVSWQFHFCPGTWQLEPPEKPFRPPFPKIGSKDSTHRFGVDPSCLVYERIHAQERIHQLLKSQYHFLC